MWNFLLKPPLWLTKLLLGVSIVVFFILGFLGYLNPLKEFLDSGALAFNIGKFRFSIYLLLKGAVTIVGLFWLTNVLSEFSKNRIHNINGINPTNRVLVFKILQICIYFIALIIALSVFSVDLTGLAIFSGTIGIGIGFGLQKITSNFISGLILLAEKSIKEGDLIELDNGTTGLIRHTGARYTLLETFDSREVMIPNEDFITNRVTNWTYSNTQGRIEISISVSYDSDLNKAYDLILEAASEHPRCSENPTPRCYLEDFADSSVQFVLQFWVDDIIEGRKRPRSDVLFTIYKKFAENNITIPFPQRDLHIKNCNTAEILK